jgi:hypothetical protein
MFKSAVLKNRLFLIFLVLCTSSWSQETNEIEDSVKLIQMSGVIISEITLEPLPYTAVFNKSRNHGVLSDFYGYFSMVAFPGDTLYFKAYNYKSSSYIVPDSLTNNRYSVIHVMQNDTVTLPTVTVYPWPSRESFAKAFVEMDPYEDDLRRAQRQLSGESLAFLAAKVDSDASLSSGYAMNQQNTKLYNYGMIPTSNIANPYAWAKLIDSWKKGELKIK